MDSKGFVFVLFSSWFCRFSTFTMQIHTTRPPLQNQESSLPTLWSLRRVQRDDSPVCRRNETYKWKAWFKWGRGGSQLLQVWHKIEFYELLGSRQSIEWSQFETVFQSNLSWQISLLRWRGGKELIQDVRQKSGLSPFTWACPSPMLKCNLSKLSEGM